MNRFWLIPLMLASITLGACTSSRPAAPAAEAASAPAAESAPAPASAQATAPASALAPVTAVDAWPHVASDDRLDARFAAPPGFTRVAVDAGSFADFLRTLPLTPRGTAVLDYRGDRLYGEEHPNIAAVVDIDVGDRDLQQCADAVIRMHAEWHYGRGDRSLAYHSFSGTALSYVKYVAGERGFADGPSLSLRTVARPVTDDHRALRSFLDEVFNYANTASLAREGVAVPFAELRGGDFFVMPGSPVGHAVLVLDVARDATGRIALLLGQSYMPAQSFHVVRPRPSSTWFLLPADATEVVTPFWKPFPVSTLRRMP
jgi:hypothetical protein